MASVVQWMDGKKSYLIAGLLALIGVVQFIAAGHFDVHAWMDFLRSEAIAGGIATIRTAIGKNGQNR